MVFYHLAQVNVARAVAPLDDPAMAGFTSRLADVNALAERSPGFVWRLQTDDGDATAVRAYEDPRILFNLSVWESAEALREYAYRSEHGGVFRARRQWFEPPSEAHLAMWWIPAGHVPGVRESVERLAWLRAHGESPFAFTFRNSVSKPPDPPEPSPVILPAVPAVQADGETTYRFGQESGRIWAVYEGGDARFGVLAGSAGADGEVHYVFQHLDAAGACCSGKGLATIDAAGLHWERPLTRSAVSE